MKYKAAGIIGILLILSAAVAAAALMPDSKTGRVHQHQQSRQPDAACSCDGSELCTHLPLVIIDTDGKKIPGEPVTDNTGEAVDFTQTEDGERMLSADISVMSDEEKNHHPSDEPDLKSRMNIRIRGNSSRFFDKNSYLLRLTEADGSYREEEMMGMDAHYEWALYGPYLDKTLIRNYMWYNISGEIMEYAPDVRFCEVILNGEYRGLYVMTETITAGKDCRLNLTEPLRNADASGYVLRIDRGSTVPVKNIKTFTNYTYRNLQNVDIKYPRGGKLTPELAGAIEQDFSDFEKSLYSYDYDTDNYGYWHDINVASFVDYFIINEFTANYDAGELSTYVYRDIGERIGLAVWDFNSACDNYAHPVTEPQHFEFQNVVWFYMMMKDEYFTDRIISRYRELRESLLSEEYLLQYVDETIEYLGPAVERNFEKWGYTFREYRPLKPDSRNPESFEDAVSALREYIRERGRWMDAHIETIKQFSHPSKNKKFNH